MEKKRIVRWSLFVIFILIFLAASRQYGSQIYSGAQDLRVTIESFGIFGPVVYILIYIVFSVFFVPSTILTVLGGVLFGFLAGTIYTLIASVIAATVAFVLSRYFAREFTEKIVRKRFKRIYRYDEKLEEKGFTTVLFLRLIPIFPFNWLNIGLGVTKVRLKDYFFATLIGVIPGKIIYAYLGDSIAELSTIDIIIAALLVMILGLSIVIYKLYKMPRSR